MLSDAEVQGADNDDIAVERLKFFYFSFAIFEIFRDELKIFLNNLLTKAIEKIKDAGIINMSGENKKTILLVNNDSEIAKTENKILKKNGFSVITASTGKEAIEIIEKTPGINLILMDIDLGKGISGVRAAEKILAKHNIPLIFLSSDAEQKIAEKTEGIASYGYIVKNSGETILISTIKMALRLFEKTEKEKMILAEKINERKLTETHTRILAEVQDILLHPCEIEDIYRLVSGKVCEMIGDCITANSMLDEKRKTVRMISYHGMNMPFEKIFQIIGFDPWHREFSLDEFTGEDLKVYRSGRLGILEGGLYTLMTRIVPKAACRIIEKMLSIEKIYAMGFIHKYAHMGSLVILARSDITPHIAAIELIVNLAAIAIERKRSEESMLENSKRYQTLFEQAGDGILILDTRGQIVSFNESFASMHGFSVEEIMQKGIEGLHVDGFHTTDERFSRILSGETLNFEVQHFHKDGHTFPLSVIANLISLDDEQLIISVHRDLSERKQAEEALRASEAFLNETGKIAKIGGWKINLETQHLTWTKEVFNLHEVSDDFQPTVEKAINFYDSSSKHIIQKAVEDAIQNETPFDVELGIITAKNNHIYIQALGNIQKDENGKAIEVNGTFQDITERKLAETNSQLLYERLLLSQEMAHVGSWEYDISTGEILGSDEALKIYHLPFSDGNFPLERIEACIPDREMVNKALVDLIAHEKTYDLVFPINPADGTEQRVISSRALLVKDENGKAIKVKGVIQDITERKKAEDELRKSELRYKQLFDAIPESVLLIGKDRCVVAANQASAQLYGYESPQQLEGFDTRLLIAERDRERASRTQADILQGEERPVRQYLEVRRDGSEFIAEVMSTTLHGPGNEVTGYIGITRDITAYVKAEEALRTSEARFIEAQQIAHIGSWEYNVATGSYWGSDEAKRLYGFNLESDNFTMEEVTKCFIDPEMVNKELFDAIESDKLIDITFDIIPRNSTEKRTLHVIGRPVRDTNGNPIKVAGTTYDITMSKLADDALKKSEEQYRLLANNVPDIIYSLDSEGKITSINNSAFERYGYNENEAIGKPFLAYVHPEDHEKIISSFLKALEDKRIITKDLQFRIMDKNGSIYWFELNARARFDSNNLYLGEEGVLRDITDRKKAEEALRSSEEKIRLSEEKYSKSMDVVSDMFVISRVRDEQYVYANRAFEIYTGLSQNEIVGKTSLEISIWKDVSDRERMTQEFRSNGFIKDFQFALQRKNGEQSIASMSASVMELNGDLHIVSVVRDITERKQIEESLKSSEKKYKILFEANTDGITIFKITGDGPPSIILDMNENAYKMLGYSREEMIVLNPADFEKNITQEQIDQRIKDLKNRGFSNFETKLRHKNGSDIDVEIKALVIKFNNQTALMNIVRDITQRKQANETIIKSLREKETLIRELYHRTKNTMQVIRGIIVLQAAKYSNNPEMDQLVKNTEDRIQAISLVHQMLYQSQDLSKISIKDYIQDLTALSIKSYSLSEEIIVFNIAVDDQKFLLDTAIPLGLILNELITNSLKYAFPDGRKGKIGIRLTLEKSGNYLLKYSDNGIGVPDGFDFRKRNSLGMKLIYSIGEEQMLGKLIIENNKGIKCTLEFPGNLYKARV